MRMNRYLGDPTMLALLLLSLTLVHGNILVLYLIFVCLVGIYVFLLCCFV